MIVAHILRKNVYVSCSGPPAEMLNDYARRVDLLRGIAEAKKLVCVVTVNLVQLSCVNDDHVFLSFFTYAGMYLRTARPDYLEAKDKVTHR